MKRRKVMKLASRGKRFGAACIDAAVPVVAVFIFIGAAIADAVRRLSYGSGFGYDFGYDMPGYGYGYGYDQGMSRGTSAAVIIALLMLIAYAIIQMVFYNKSKTIGKAALGLQVISSTDGEPIGFWKMLLREWIVKQASGAFMCLGFIWILVDDKNRGWHDKILDTYVVDLKESERLAANARAERERHSSVRPRTQAAPVQQPVSPVQTQAAPVQTQAAPTQTAPAQKPAADPAPIPLPAVTVSPERESDQAQKEPAPVIEMPGTVEETAEPDVSAEPVQITDVKAEEAVIELPGISDNPEPIREDE